MLSFGNQCVGKEMVYLKPIPGYNIYLQQELFQVGSESLAFEVCCISNVYMNGF